MKNIIFYIFLLFIALACQPQQSIRPLLEKADSLLVSHPDSAFLMLDTVSNLDKYAENEYAEWCLLLTQARDKSYREHTSDSLIRIATDYYRGHGPSLKYATALYTAGRVASELGRPEFAVKYYLEAEQVGKETDDYRLLYLITSNLGGIYGRLCWNDSTLNVYKKSLEYAKLSGDSVFIARANSYMGRAYSLFNEWDKSHQYYEQAVEMLWEIKNYGKLTGTLNEWAGISILRKDWKQANRCIQELDSIPDIYKQLNKSQICLVKGQFYLQTGDYDLADLYLQKALLSDSPYTVRDAYNYLYELKKQQGEHEKATEYEDKWRACNSSILVEKEQITEVPKNYEMALFRERQIAMKWKYSFFITILAIAFIHLCFAYRNRQKQLREKTKALKYKEELLESYYQRLEQNNQTIQQNKEMQESLSKQYESSMQENRELKQTIEKISQDSTRIEQDNKQLLRKISVLEKFNASAMTAKTEAEIRKSSMLLLLKEKPIPLNQQRQWDELYLSMNVFFNNFVARLKEKYPHLSDVEVNYCCLFKAGFSISDIATIMSVQPTSVSRRKYDIKKHLKLDTTLDKFIQEF